MGRRSPKPPRTLAIRSAQFFSRPGKNREKWAERAFHHPTCVRAGPRHAMAAGVDRPADRLGHRRDQRGDGRDRPSRSRPAPATPASASSNSRRARHRARLVRLSSRDSVSLGTWRKVERFLQSAENIAQLVHA